MALCVAKPKKPVTRPSGYIDASRARKRCSLLTSPTVVASAREGTRQNDIPKGQSGAMDEQNTAFSLGLGIPVGELMGYTTVYYRAQPSGPAVFDVVLRRS